MSDEKKPDISKGLSVAAATGGLTSIAGGPKAGVIGGAIALGGWAIAELVEGLNNRSRRRADSWWKELIRQLVAGGAGAADDVERQVAAKLLDDETIQDVVAEGVRGAVDALDPSVLPALARVTAVYCAQGKRPDPFLREVVRLLRELSAEDLGSLRSLAVQVSAPDLPAHFKLHAMLVQGDTPRIPFASLIDGVGLEVFAVWFEATGKPEGPTEVRRPFAQIARPYRLFRLLRAHGFAMEGFGGLLDTHAGPDVVSVDRETLERIRDILGNEPTSKP